MPILFNFHILLATFYTIFGTNILIECPVPVPVCCMFYVSQKPHIKRSPNGIKMDGEYFWNICDFWEEESMWDGARGGHRAGVTPLSLVAPHKAVDALLLPQESYFLVKKSRRMFQANRSYGSPYIYETVKGQQSRRQKQRETERQIQSRRGSRPSHAMEAKDQRGNPSPI